MGSASSAFLCLRRLERSMTLAQNPEWVESNGQVRDWGRRWCFFAFPSFAFRPKQYQVKFLYLKHLIITIDTNNLAKRPISKKRAFEIIIFYSICLRGKLFIASLFICIFKLSYFFSLVLMDKDSCITPERLNACKIAHSKNNSI